MTDEGLDGPELGAELGDLYRAGRVWMPGLADRFRSAARAFPGEELEWACRRAFDVGLTDAGPYPAWRELADTLVGLPRPDRAEPAGVRRGDGAGRPRLRGGRRRGLRGVHPAGRPHRRRPARDHRQRRARDDLPGDERPRQRHLPPGDRGRADGLGLLPGGRLQHVVPAAVPRRLRRTASCPRTS